MTNNLNQASSRVYSKEYLLQFKQQVPPNQKIVKLISECDIEALHPCLRYNEGKPCKFGDRCIFREMPRDWCLECLRGDIHEHCWGSEPNKHPCLRVWDSCRFGEGCAFRDVPRIWCLFCLRGDKTHPRCSGWKPRNMPYHVNNTKMNEGQQAPQQCHKHSHQHHPTTNQRNNNVQQQYSPSHMQQVHMAPPVEQPPVERPQPEKQVEKDPSRVLQGLLNKITRANFDAKLAEMLVQFARLDVTNHPEACAPFAGKVLDRIKKDPDFELITDLAEQLATSLPPFKKHLLDGIQTIYQSKSVIPEGTDQEEVSRLKNLHRRYSKNNISFIAHLFNKKLIPLSILKIVFKEGFAKKNDEGIEDVLLLLNVLYPHLQTMGPAAAKLVNNAVQEIEAKDLCSRLLFMRQEIFAPVACSAATSCA